MKHLFDEERKQPRLHHSQKSVLKSLATHWEGLTDVEKSRCRQEKLLRIGCDLARPVYRGDLQYLRDF